MRARAIAAAMFLATPAASADTIVDCSFPRPVAGRSWDSGRYAVEAASGDLGPGAVATVTAWCAAHGVMPEGLALGRRTLEDVFLELTGRAPR